MILKLAKITMICKIKTIVSLFVVGLASSVMASALPVNGSFKSGLEGWQASPSGKFAKVINAGEGHETALELAPIKRNFGVNSRKMIIGKDISVDIPFAICFQSKLMNVTDGVFGASLLLLDEKGKRIKQIPIPVGKGKWRNTQSVFGGTSRNQISKSVHSIVIRFSFWSKTNNVSGKALIDNVTVKILPNKTDSVDAGWPKSILADIGSLQTRFEKRSFWTPYRLAWKGTLICKDLYGCHYGVVCNFPKIGFIGSGHCENDNEKLISLKLSVDGKLITKPVKYYKCMKSIELVKKSQIKNLLIEQVTIAQKDCLIEKVTLEALKAEKLNYLYIAMHPWLETMTDYAAFKGGEVILSGKFDNNNKMKICKRVKITAVYSENLKKGAVTIIKHMPDNNNWQVDYWDRPNVYRKFYFRNFINTIIQPGKKYYFELVTIPFESSPEKWLQTASAISAKN